MSARVRYLRLATVMFDINYNVSQYIDYLNEHRQGKITAVYFYKYGD